jgi:hypothetical protein
MAKIKIKSNARWLREYTEKRAAGWTLEPHPTLPHYKVLVSPKKSRKAAKAAVKAKRSQK